VYFNWGEKQCLFVSSWGHTIRVFQVNRRGGKFVSRTLVSFIASDTVVILKLLFRIMSVRITWKNYSVYLMSLFIQPHPGKYPAQVINGNTPWVGFLLALFL
jgi:hypothetical protein